VLAEASHSDLTHVDVAVDLYKSDFSTFMEGLMNGGNFGYDSGVQTLEIPGGALSLEGSRFVYYAKSAIAALGFDPELFHNSGTELDSLVSTFPRSLEDSENTDEELDEPSPEPEVEEEVSYVSSLQSQISVAKSELLSKLADVKRFLGVPSIANYLNEEEAVIRQWFMEYNPPIAQGSKIKELHRKMDPYFIFDSYVDLIASTGKSIQELADEVGISFDTARKWKAGDVAQPRDKNVWKLLEVCTPTPENMVRWVILGLIETLPSDHELYPTLREHYDTFISSGTSKSELDVFMQTCRDNDVDIDRIIADDQ